MSRFDNLLADVGEELVKVPPIRWLTRKARRRWTMHIQWCEVHLSGEIADHCELERCLAARLYDKPQSCNIVSARLVGGEDRP